MKAAFVVGFDYANRLHFIIFFQGTGQDRSGGLAQPFDPGHKEF